LHQNSQMTPPSAYSSETMHRAGGIDYTGAPIPVLSIGIWEGVQSAGDEGPATIDPSALRDLFGTAANLMCALASRPPGPVMVQAGGFSLHGHALGTYGSMVCGFPSGDVAAAYRCYGRGLSLLTDGRIRLVPYRRFPAPPSPDRLLLQGPVDGQRQAYALLAQFRGLLSDLGSARQARRCELAFTELAANTLRHGRQGWMAVYRENDDLLILAKDQGPGIPSEILPSSLLVVGYTTVPGSLGAGLPTIIRLAETVTIATGEKGTSILVRLKSTPTEVN
jgi:anti-sigma regulatory factor (Ser/Thr protein kinase)